MRQVAQHLAEVAGEEEVGDPGRCLVVDVVGRCIRTALALLQGRCMLAGWL